jgi:type II secretory pathway predicted ATPase ExeA
MIDRVQAFYGLERPPFGRALAPGMLHKHASHNEAVARITWCITNHALGVVTGEVGAGKTVALRAAIAGLDAARYTPIYIPNPAIGMRGLYEAIVATLGGSPSYRTSSLMAQANDALAAEVAERGRVPILIIEEAHLLDHEQLEAIRMLTLCRDRDYAGECQERPGSRVRTFPRPRHNPRPYPRLSRNARSLSGGRYLPGFVFGDAVRARAFSLSLRSAWM